MTIYFSPEEIYRIWSRFSTACFTLKRSGDYPEEGDDKQIERKLLNWKFQIEEDQRKGR